MEELIIIIVILFAIASIFYLKINGENADLSEVESSLDNRKYLVRNMPDRIDAANALAKLRNNLVTIVNYMTTKHPTDDRVLRLKDNFRPDNISESLPDAKYTSYTINKGEKIVFCIRQKDSENTLLDINTMTFVGIHELAHLMSSSIGHNTEFWDNMKFLLKCVVDSGLNIYKYTPYHKEPKEYCGTNITDTPLK